TTICTTDSCDSVLGCQNDPVAAGTTCEDDSNACTDDECNATGTCLHSVISYDNGEYCDGTETCDIVLGYQSGTPPTCTDDTATECINESLCNETTDACGQNIADTTLCYENICIENQSCLAGICQGGTVVTTETDCEDGVDNDCDGTCDIAGCMALPADEDCCGCGSYCPLVPSAANQYDYYIFDNYVAYREQIGSYQVFLYNFTTQTSIQLTGAGATASNAPAGGLARELIMYADSNFSYVLYYYDNGDGNDLYLYNINSSDLTPNNTYQITTSGVALDSHANDLSIAAYANRIVWEQVDNNLYYLDLNDITSDNLQLTSGELNRGPILYADTLIWRQASGVAGIYRRDLNLLPADNITFIFNPGFTHYLGGLYGNNLVYFRSTVNDVYWCDITGCINNLVDDSDTQARPHVYGNTLVWENSESGSQDIRYFEIGGSNGPVAASTATESHPIIYGDHVVYRNASGGFYQLYHHQFSPSCGAVCIDLDFDGWGYGCAGQEFDCNDTPIDGFNIHPGVTEVFNGKDDNCDGQIDEGFQSITQWFDEDGDGYGNEQITDFYVHSMHVVGECTNGTFCIEDSNCAGIGDNLCHMMNGDCVDDDPLVNPMSPYIYPGQGQYCGCPATDPGATNPQPAEDTIEFCWDGLDNDCNGLIDEEEGIVCEIACDGTADTNINGTVYPNISTSHLQAVASAGTNQINVADASSFSVGEKILIVYHDLPPHQNEYNVIDSILDNQITLVRNLINNYPASGTSVVQVRQYNNITITSTGRMLAQPYDMSIAEGGVLAVCANNITINGGGIISASETGFPSGNAYTAGFGYGGGLTSDLGYGGGGHGGAGGYGGGTLFTGGLAYGDRYNPVTLGSGGATKNLACCANPGGGIIMLTVKNTITNNGTISANGGNAPPPCDFLLWNQASAGSSGGSINILSNNINGSGAITAYGGTGADGDRDGGGGGGGRILTKQCNYGLINPPLATGGESIGGGPGGGEDGFVGTVEPITITCE
ncbi:putative metal-binding motif-containing protein, partial [Patescibacteria group bacterium]|nr:putative metal-binding motif-containing protein [Patescibacteria group bacterium]